MKKLAMVSTMAVALSGCLSTGDTAVTRDAAPSYDCAWIAASGAGAVLTEQSRCGPQDVSPHAMDG